MVKDGTMRVTRAVAARAVAGVVLVEGWVAWADEEALVAPEAAGVGAFGAALVAALTFAWLLVRLRRGAAVPVRPRTACWPGELRPWGGPLGARLSRCAGRRRQRPLAHRGRRRSF